MKKLFFIVAIGFCITAHAAEITRVVEARLRNNSLDNETSEKLVSAYLGCLASHSFIPFRENEGKDLFFKQLVSAQTFLKQLVSAQISKTGIDIEAQKYGKVVRDVTFSDGKPKGLNESFEELKKFLIQNLSEQNQYDLQSLPVVTEEFKDLYAYICTKNAGTVVKEYHSSYHVE